MQAGPLRLQCRWENKFCSRTETSHKTKPPPERVKSSTCVLYLCRERQTCTYSLSFHSSLGLAGMMHKQPCPLLRCCKVDCSIACWMEWHCSLSLPASFSCTLSLFFYLLLPLLLSARSLAVQTAQLSSVLPVPQQLLHEPCVSECAVTFKGERNLQGQCAPHCHPPTLPLWWPPHHHHLPPQQLVKTFLKKRYSGVGWGGG